MRADPNDPSIAHLAQLTTEFREHEAAAAAMRTKMDHQIQAMKAAGYSYPVLAKVAGLAIASIQYSVARERATKQGPPGSTPPLGRASPPPIW